MERSGEVPREISVYFSYNIETESEEKWERTSARYSEE